MTKPNPTIIVCTRCKKERKEHCGRGICKYCSDYVQRFEKYKDAPMIKCTCSSGCEVLIKAWDKWGHPRKYAVGHNGILNIGKRNGQYRNGIAKTSGGYYQYLFRGHPFSTKKGRVMFHRIVYEMYHLCCLLPWADIHHIDGNKKRNHPENLRAMLHEIHMSLTHKGIKHERKRIRRKCIDCGSKITYKRKSNNSPFWYKATSNRYRCQKCYNKKEKVS